MKNGYWKNTTVVTGKVLLFALWLTKPMVNTRDSTNYSNKSQCWTVQSLRFLTMMWITEKRYCTTALTLYSENTIGITPKYGSFTQKAAETSNQNQHDPSAEPPASVGMK